MSWDCDKTLPNIAHLEEDFGYNNPGTSQPMKF